MRALRAHPSPRTARRRTFDPAAFTAALALAPSAVAQTVWEEDLHPTFWWLAALIAAVALVLGAKFALQALKERREERDRRDAQYWE